MKKPLFHPVGTVRCPECGAPLLVPTRVRYFVCSSNWHKLVNNTRTNNKKYKVPTIELEEYNP